MNNYYRIAKSIEFIKENFRSQPDLNEIAKNVYLSPHHFQRMFTDWAGVSPKKFIQFMSLGHAKNILIHQQATLSDAAFETGLSGTGRLHDLFVSIDGMTPGEFKNGGENLNINFSFNESPFGLYLVASTPKGICNLQFIEDKNSAIENLKLQWFNADIKEMTDVNHDRVTNFFLNDFQKTEKIKLHLKGTEFQLKVWQALLNIPEGHLRSYANISNNVCTEKASRAVGSAIGKNPVAYIIPCHRVIKKSGHFGEYRWGTTRKIAMIYRELNKIRKAV
ncbi:MAG: methylated-DNA--[protein]-cysteine S-methyltransferase [Ignavibacteria bacterium]